MFPLVENPVNRSRCDEPFRPIDRNAILQAGIRLYRNAITIVEIAFSVWTDEHQDKFSAFPISIVEG